MMISALHSQSHCLRWSWCIRIHQSTRAREIVCEPGSSGVQLSAVSYPRGRVRSYLIYRNRRVCVYKNESTSRICRYAPPSIALSQNVRLYNNSWAVIVVNHRICRAAGYQTWSSSRPQGTKEVRHMPYFTMRYAKSRFTPLRCLLMKSFTRSFYLPLPTGLPTHHLRPWSSHQVTVMTIAGQDSYKYALTHILNIVNRFNTICVVYYVFIVDLLRMAHIAK